MVLIVLKLSGLRGNELYADAMKIKIKYSPFITEDTSKVMLATK